MEGILAQTAVGSNKSQAVVFYPKYYDHSRPYRFLQFPGSTELLLDDWYAEGVGSDEEPSVPFEVEEPLPQVGYLSHDLVTRVSFLHPGDLHHACPELAEVRGKVDILFLPIGKLGLQGDERALELICPRYVVPIHYRYEGDDYPIPKLYKEDESPEQKILGHHFPTPEDPDAYIAELRQLAAPLSAKVLPLRAGVRYEL